MAYAEPAFVSQALDTPHEKYSTHTLTTSKQLSDALDHIRQAGVAHTNEEFAEGVMGVAMPIFVKEQDKQPLAAVTVYGPKYRLAQKDTINETVHRLSECIQQIQNKLSK